MLPEGGTQRVDLIGRELKAVREAIRERTSTRDALLVKDPRTRGENDLLMELENDIEKLEGEKKRWMRMELVRICRGEDSKQEEKEGPPRFRISRGEDSKQEEKKGPPPIIPSFRVEANILNIDEFKHEVMIDVNLYFQWQIKDGQLTEERMFNGGWIPEISFLDLMEEAKFIGTRHFTNIRDEEGQRYFVAVRSWVCKLNVCFDLECFPFDRQYMQLSLNSIPECRLAGHTEFRPTELPIDFPTTQLQGEFRTTQWVLESIGVLPETTDTSGSPQRTEVLSASDESERDSSVHGETTSSGEEHHIEDAKPKWHFTLLVKRVPTSYLRSHALIFFFLGLCAFAPLISKNTALRLSMNLTLLLVTVTAKLATSQYIPPSGKLTYIGAYVLIVFSLQLIVILWSVLVTLFVPPRVTSHLYLHRWFAVSLMGLWALGHGVAWRLYMLDCSFGSSFFVPSEKQAWNHYVGVNFDRVYNSASGPITDT